MGLYPNGRYQIIDCEHMGISEGERGVWTMRDDLITLTPLMPVKEIATAHISVNTAIPKLHEHIDDIRLAYSDFIRKGKYRETYAPDVFKRIHQVKGADGTALSAIAVSTGTVSLPREEMWDFRDRFGAYSGSTEEVPHRVRIKRFRNITYLVDLDDSSDESEAEKDDLIRWGIRRGDLMLVYVSITKSQFFSGALRTHAFVFSKELNRCVPSETSVNRFGLGRLPTIKPHELLLSPNPYTWLNAALSLAAEGDRECIPYLIKSLRNPPYMDYDEPGSYLQQLTGKQFGPRDFRAWRDWWKQTHPNSIFDFGAPVRQTIPSFVQPVAPARRR